MNSLLRRPLRIVVAPWRRIRRRRLAGKYFNLWDQDAWSERSITAARLYAETESGDGSGRADRTLRVADIGCGDRKLARHLEDVLRREFRYTGYDIAPQSSDVTRLNITTELPESHFDVIFLLGVIEYIDDLSDLFSRLSDASEKLVVSYVVAADTSRKKLRSRTRYGWRHHYSYRHVRQLLLELGYTILTDGEADGGQTVIFVAQHG